MFLCSSKCHVGCACFGGRSYGRCEGCGGVSNCVDCHNRNHRVPEKPKTAKTRFLNAAVAAEVEADPALSAAWTTSYDEEIDPVHNCDWLTQQQRQEVELLAAIKARLGKRS